MTTDQAPAGQASEDDTEEDEVLARIAFGAMEQAWRSWHLNDGRPNYQPVDWNDGGKLDKAQALFAAKAVRDAVRSDQAAELRQLQDEYLELRRAAESAAFGWGSGTSKCHLLARWLNANPSNIAAHPAPPIETTGVEDA